MKLAGCVITDRGGKFYYCTAILTDTSTGKFPGGKIKPGEATLAAAVREIQEEQGVPVTIDKLLGARAFHDSGYQFHYSWYLAKVTKGTPTIMETATFDSLGYFSVQDLMAGQLSLSSGLQAFLALLEDGLVTID